MSDEEQINIKELKFVLYARKSTSGDERQERSIPDQIADCHDLRDRENLNIIEVIKEQESAKDPDIRPKFKKMIEGLKAGKYDGIIVWHPDRLARNMKDAGEIIDLLDKGIIKHIAFATYAFENNPMGKMLLGISFVLSKQYSDHLSENVKRGVRRAISEGKYVGSHKHGYYKGTEGRLYPDGESWRLIKDAFYMRKDNHTLQEIADHLNKYEYSCIKGNKRQKYKMDPKLVSNILKDPIYAGFLLYGEELVYLPDVYDFTPAIEAEDFLDINEEESILSVKFKSKRIAKKSGSVEANLMRKMVYCGECNKVMSSGITTKPNKDERRYYYRCETKNCKMKNRSVRPKIILEFAYEFLEKHQFTTEKAYQKYREEVEEMMHEANKENKSKLQSLRKQLTERNKTYERTKNIIRDGNEDTAKHFKGDLETIESEIENIKSSIKGIKNDIENNKKSIMTYEQYLELYKDIGSTLRKTKDLELMDSIMRQFFSNFTVKNGVVSDFTLQKPFKELVEAGEFSGGGAGWVRTTGQSVMSRLL